jgi:DNA-binding transcriptional MerR regulator
MDKEDSLVTTTFLCKKLKIDRGTLLRYEEEGRIKPVLRLPDSGHRRYSLETYYFLKKKLFGDLENPLTSFEFAEQIEVSNSTLVNWERIGKIIPAHVNEWNNRRYYSQDQLKKYKEVKKWERV